jgi:RNA polymerase sigma-70 factor, ECF subfamily
MTRIDSEVRLQNYPIIILGDSAYRKQKWRTVQLASALTCSGRFDTMADGNAPVGGEIRRRLGNFRQTVFVEFRQGTVSDDEHHLIAASREGDTAAFGVLVRRYQDRLYRTAARLVDNPEDARDVVQEAFLHAFQALGTFKGDALFFTWLYRIAVNTAISLRRKRKPVASIHAAPSTRDAAEPLDSNDHNRPGHALEQAEQEQRIRRALAQLSVEHREVLVMKDMEGQKYEAMAEALGVPIGTIRSRLHRARLELRELLQKDEA